jgi:MFS family permease
MLLFRKIQPFLVLIAGFLIHFTLGVFQTFGNLVPYIISYARKRSQPASIRYLDATYLLAVQIAGRTFCTVLGGLLEKKFGPRVSTFIGGFLLSSGVLSSFFVIKANYWILLVTYGLLLGAGFGMSYIGSLSCALKWFPKRKGLVTALIGSGFTLCCISLPALQTFYINPNNEKPDYAPYPKFPDEKYFVQSDVLDRVPYIFLIMGGIFGVLQVFGSIFLVNPPPEESVNEATPLANNIRINTASDDYLIKSSSAISLHQQSRKMSIIMVLKNPTFYVLWVVFFLTRTNISFITSLYKTFGLEQVTNDDVFMMILLTVSSIFGIIGRIVWGILTDYTSYKFALVIQLSLVTCTVSTLYATTAVHESMFFIWICMLYFGIAGNFTIIPAAVAKEFGQKNFSIVFGMIVTGLLPAGLSAALLSSYLVDLINWYGVYFILTAFNILAFIIVLIFMKDKRGS